MIQTCYEYLKPNRKLLINISDISRGENVLPLEQETISLCLHKRFHYVGKIGMTMTRMIGLKTKGLKNSWFDKSTNTDYKIEPILVFEKR